MITEAFSNISTPELLIFFLVALFIGMSKTGVHGAGMMAVPLLAAIFGGQRSSGIMLPLLCIADVMGVWYYHRHASWPHLKKLFPWAAIGTIAGVFTGDAIDDQTFRLIMAVIIVISIVIMIWLEKDRRESVPDYYWFAAVTGIAGGFTSMIGNLAGSVMAIYFLSMRLPKNAFIGTTAWFFMVINWFKIPFHVWSWKTIDGSTLLMDLCATPVIALGAYLGIKVVSLLPERTYRWFIIAMTLVAGALMLF